MKIHLIACGGAVMHNLTIALHKKGYRITGSDDEIFDPAKSRLQQFGLLPAEWGWFPEKLSSDIDAVILGMHARRDNPELIRALELGLKVYSFPEYLYEQTKHKKRIVIGGSHGKTSVTSMIMHVIKNRGLSFDYMVGANIEGFETMVNLDENNSLAVFEGDEYLSSPIDLRPKFHWYRPHIAVLTGVAWDHINVFPTFGDYLRQFSMFVDIVEPGGCLIYYKNDENLYNLLHEKTGLRLIPYSEPESIPDGDGSIIKLRQNDYAVSLFGKHNMQNINA
ncbi:MAG TPA: Mur ligase family protein, partial [Bacteroidales bacterium]|nr:Mur ligase family protein [Bacteroidales bacterium]